MTDHNLLEDIFKTPEKDVETFADIIEINQNKFSPNEVLQLKKTASFKEEQQGAIFIQHGVHERHYVWHIRTAHRKQVWGVTIDRVLFAIGKILNDKIPREVMIDIFPPKTGWDIEEITVKINDSVDHWSLSQSDFDSVTGQFFEVLNTLVKGPR